MARTEHGVIVQTRVSNQFYSKMLAHMKRQGYHNLSDMIRHSLRKELDSRASKTKPPLQ